MKKILTLIFLLLAVVRLSAQSSNTLIVFYSYTNNCRQIVSTLQEQITADVLEIEAAEEDIDYAANNYAIGSSLISAINTSPDSLSSYPDIKDVDVSLDNYKNIIIVAPLWWSHMAAPLQTFLFKYGAQMAGKNIGLIVKSASSGISTVVSDAKRLIPDGKFMSANLSIKDATFANRSSLIEQWLKDVDYAELADSGSNKIYISVGDTTLTATLENNSSADSLISLLKQGNITIEMSDYGGFEKVGDLPAALPRNDIEYSTVPGDLILYLGTRFVIYYGYNSYNFTKLGKIDNISEERIKLLLGTGNCTATLSLKCTSGIMAVKTDSVKLGNSYIYSIGGRLLPYAPDKGIYIENGIKKVANKH